MKKKRNILKVLFSKEQLLTLIVAFIALIVSVRSCSIAERATHLAESDFYQQRLITLTATIEDEKNYLKIKPTDDNITLVKARAYFPDDFDKTEWSISSPDYNLYVIVLKSKIREMLNDILKPYPNYHQFIDDASIPVVIESQYIAKGVSYFDRSLYRIEYFASMGVRKYAIPEIKIKGLLFDGHLNPTEDSQELLSNIWNTILSHRKKLKKGKNVEQGHVR